MTALPVTVPTHTDLPVNEEWRPIPGAPAYEASSEGRVRSWKRGRKARVLRPALNANGYLYLALRIGGQTVHRTVHRLVLSAFQGAPTVERPHARHLNGCRTDNRASNLAWGTPSENQYDKVRHGTHQNAIKTHCPYGHPYDAENTVRYGQGRVCRACIRRRSRELRARRKATRTNTEAAS